VPRSTRIIPDTKNVRTELKRAIISPLFCVTLLLSIISRVYASPALAITVTTDEQGYYPGDSVQIYGNLTLNQALVPDGLVGLEVRNPQNTLIIIRTLSTGTIPQYTPYVVVWSVTPCDSSGNPRSSFTRGTLGYFQLYVRNYDIQPHEALMTVNTYDNKSVPFGSASFKVELSPESPAYILLSVPIDTAAALGVATVYANVYTDWPRLLGTPHCRELSATFQITAGSLSKTLATQEPPAATAEINGNYQTTFQLASSAKPGTCTMYVTSNYQGEETSANATFKIYILGDLNRDGLINYKDLFKFRYYYLYEYNVDADLNRDGIINFLDLFIFRQNYIKYA